MAVGPVLTVTLPRSGWFTSLGDMGEGPANPGGRLGGPVTGPPPVVDRPTYRCAWRTTNLKTQAELAQSRSGSSVERPRPISGGDAGRRLASGDILLSAPASRYRSSLLASLRTL